jgi:sulfur carrier protein ThiS
VTQQKTVAQLLNELELSDNHVVLHSGKRLDLEDIIGENDEVVVLPIIEGG